MGRSFCRALAGCSLIGAVLAADSLSFSVSDKPDDASDAVSPSFAGFGLEPSQLFYFLGDASPNDFSNNLLANLADYTGQPPHIRLGGNSQDYMIYDPDQTEWRIKPNANPQGPGDTAPADAMIIGPRFFEVANRFPQGTPTTWGLNLAYDVDGYLDKVVTMAQQVVDRCTNLNLVSFEIGNEPDLYTYHEFRSDSWDGSDYVEEWTERAAAVYQEVLKPKGTDSNFFDSAATTAWVAGTTFAIENLQTYGIDAQGNNSANPYLASWDQHDYFYFLNSGSTFPITLDYMTTWDNTESQFIEALGEQLEEAKATSFPYALREMGVVGPIGLAGVSNTFAAGLWTLNFLLYAATLNISSVGFHMTVDSAASAWRPVEFKGNSRVVRPLYYGMAAFDQMIGASCSARVANATIDALPNGYEGYVRAYSVYQGEGLGSIAVINGKTANVSNSDKPSMTVQVSLPTSLVGQTVHLSYLTSDGADAIEGTTWNGLSFEESGDGTSTTVSDDDPTVQVGDDGTLSLTVRDSEAIVASFGKKVGSDPGSDENACTALVTQGVGATATAAAGSKATDGSDSGAARFGSVSSSVAFGFAAAAGILLV